MSEDKVILELCDRFGVGVEKLIPQVIQHGQTSSGIALTFSVIGFVIFAAIFICMFFIRRKADSYSTLEGVCDLFMIIGGMIIFVLLICIVCNSYDHYMWMHSPRIMAIKYILSSIGGN